MDLKNEGDTKELLQDDCSNPYAVSGDDSENEDIDRLLGGICGAVCLVQMMPIIVGLVIHAVDIFVDIYYPGSKWSFFGWRHWLDRVVMPALFLGSFLAAVLTMFVVWDFGLAVVGHWLRRGQSLSRMWTK